MQALTWHGYLMATHQLASGWTAATPEHQRRAGHITWDARTAGIAVRRARTSAVDSTGRNLLAGVGGDAAEADALVCTGPGDALRQPGQPANRARARSCWTGAPSGSTWPAWSRRRSRPRA
jgi:hypothetical protein